MATVAIVYVVHVTVIKNEKEFGIVEMVRFNVFCMVLF